MATVYDCVIYFEGQGRGWSEKYTLDAERTGLPAPPASPNYNSLTLLDAFFDTLVQKRRLLLGKQYNITAQRVSRVPSDRRSRLGYRFYQGNQSHDADVADTDLVVSCDNVDDSAHKLIHMGGIWDSINVEGGVFRAAPPEWTTHWNSFVGELVGRQGGGAYGWWGKLQSFVSPITQYVQTVDGFVTFDLDDTIFLGVPPGNVVQVRISQLNGGPSELNGQLTVRVETSSRCTSIRRISVFPYVGGGAMRYNTNQFIDIAQVRPQKIGRRGRGAPLFQLRGRQRASIRS